MLRAYLAGGAALPPDDHLLGGLSGQVLERLGDLEDGVFGELLLGL